MMYTPPTFFSAALLKQVLEEFQWPVPYQLEEEDACNILLRFPECTLVVSEGFESDMVAYFLNSEVGRTDNQQSLTIADAIRTVKARVEGKPGFQEPAGFTHYPEPKASLNKVTAGVRNICILLQTYLLPCIGGDFSWVEEYNQASPWDVAR